MKGRPISEAPRDGTVILVETMNHAGVPETGGYEFRRMVPSGILKTCWSPIDEPNSHYGSECILRWWPGDIDLRVLDLTLTPRTNWNYRPSNGSEGEYFQSQWCDRCIHERPIREHYDYAAANGLGCMILLRTMGFDIGDSDYPKEWTLAPDGKPKCIAFIRDVGKPAPDERCNKTIDMFADTGPAATGKPSHEGT